jgi:hypothetical protein
MYSKLRHVCFLSFVMIAILLSLVACAQPKQAAPTTVVLISEEEQTQTPNVIYVTQKAEIHNASFTMKSGTELRILPLTSLQVIEEPVTSDSGETVLGLSDGKVVIVPTGANQAAFTVRNPKGVSASLTGCAMAVAYDQSDDTFEMYCVGGKCQVKTDNPVNVDPGKYLVIHGTDIKAPAAFDAAAFKEKFNVDMPVCKGIPLTGGESATKTPVPTVNTPVPTVNRAGTATAACAAFERKFPATPCP